MKRTLVAGTGVLLTLMCTTAPPASAKIDSDSPVSRGGCDLNRIDTQLVRCDNLTGAGVVAPAAIPEL